MKTIRDIRLANARSLAPSGPAKFADTLGMMRQQASSIIGTTPRKAIGDKLARRIEEVFGKPEGWLDRDHGEATPAAAPASVAADFADVPMLGDVGDGDLILRARVPRKWLDKLRVRSPASLGFVTAHGDAMFDTVPDGSQLLIESGASVDSSGIYAVQVGDRIEARLLRPRGDGSVQVIADNHAYPPEVVAKEDLYPVIGRALLALPIVRL